MTEGINLNQSNVAFYMYSIKKGGGGGQAISSANEDVT